MRISTKGRYGLRAMFELAQGFGEGPLLMSTIAERQGLSRKHLHALLTTLKTAGLVQSVRGPGGGFVLARAPGQIRLSEVLHALEGPFSLVPCVTDRKSCDRVRRCAARGVWQDLSNAIEEVLDGATLQDLVGTAAKVCSEPGGKRTQPRSGRKSASSISRRVHTPRRA